jgi:hypothetical protein
VLSGAAAAAAGGDLSFSSEMGRERAGQGGLSMSASMPLISQLESTFQTGRRLLETIVLKLLVLLVLTLRITGTMPPQKAAALLRDVISCCAMQFMCD